MLSLAALQHSLTRAQTPSQSLTHSEVQNNQIKIGFIFLSFDDFFHGVVVVIALNLCNGLLKSGLPLFFLEPLNMNRIG